ncbi:MAG: ribonuclease H-like domain-containing protein [Planctomycetota bacterium]|nr:ribonuclease H-like domain-containing protein [Planctomycetota bacterium]
MHLNLPFGPVMSFDVQTGYAWDRAGERDRGLATPGLVVTRCMARGTRVWVSRMTNGAVSRRLSPGDAHALLREIRTAQCSGTRVVTFNGTAFDFAILGRIARDLDLASLAARESYDLMFSVWNATGRMHSLKALADANQIHPPLGAVSGDWPVESREVPDMWSHGRDDLVSVHAARQCILTEALDRLLERDGALWIPTYDSPKGRVRIEMSRARPIGVELRERLGSFGTTAREAAHWLHEIEARAARWLPRTQWLLPYMLPIGTYKAAADLEVERWSGPRDRLRPKGPPHSSRPPGASKPRRNKRRPPDPEWPNSDHPRPESPGQG